MKDKNNMTLSETGAKQILDLITENRYSEGDRIPSEFELMTQLGLSRGTIREAVKILVTQNILKIERGKGTYINSLSGQNSDPLGIDSLKKDASLARDILEARLKIEPWVAGLAAQNASDQQISDMLRLCDNFKQLYDRHEKSDELKKAWLETDRSLHILIAEASGNSIIPSIVRGMLHGIQLFSRASEAGENVRESAMITHLKIVEAISAHNSDEAATCMENHLLGNIENINRLF